MKNKEPAIALPPQGMALTGFRDPYIIQKGGNGEKWKLILGSGTKEQGGTILLYESDKAASGKHKCLCQSMLFARTASQASGSQCIDLLRLLFTANLMMQACSWQPQK